MSRRSKVVTRRVRRAPGRRGELGTALVEFALVMPILMLTLTGMTSFAVGLYWMQQIANATTSAAIYLGNDVGITTDPCATVRTQVLGALPTTGTKPALAPANFSYILTVAYLDSGSMTTSSYDSTSGGGFTCTAAAANLQSNYPVTVTVSYAYTWLPVMNWKTYHVNLTSNLSATEAALAQ